MFGLFLFSGLLPWQYFAGSLTKSSNSLVDNTGLVTKIYFPRLVIPISAVLSGLIDFAVSAIVLVGLLVFYGQALTPAAFFLPFFLLLALLTTLGSGLWFSALNVRYRDVKHLLPFVLQIWMYLTPVVYGTDLIPARLHWLLALNPMTGVVSGFRWAILGIQMNEIQTFRSAEGPLFMLSILISLVVLVSGLLYFRNTESTFADII